MSVPKDARIGTAIGLLCASVTVWCAFYLDEIAQIRLSLPVLASAMLLAAGFQFLRWFVEPDKCPFREFEE